LLQGQCSTLYVASLFVSIPGGVGMLMATELPNTSAIGTELVGALSGGMVGNVGNVDAAPLTPFREPA